MSDRKTSVDDIFARRQRWGKILLGITAVLLLILSLIPVGIRMGATSWLEDHGVKQAEIDNVDLNLFNGTFAIEGLVADDGLKVGRLFVDVDWWPLFSHKAFIRSVVIKGVEADLHQGNDGVWQLSTIQLDQTTEEPSKQVEENGEPWQVVLNQIDIADVKLHAEGMHDNKPFDLSLPLDALNITLLKAEEGGAQSLKHSLKLGEVTFNGLGYQLQLRQLKLDHTHYLPAMGTDIVAGHKIDAINLGLSDILIVDKKHGVDLAAVGNFQLKNASVAGASRALFDQLLIEKIKLPTAGGVSLGDIGDVSLKGGDFDFSGSYHLQELAINDLQASIKKLKSGKISVLEKLSGEATGKEQSSTTKGEEKAADPETIEKSKASTAEATTAKAPVVYIDRFLVGKGSSISYRDESLFPLFDTKMEVQQFSFMPVDLSGTETGKLDMLLNLNKNGSLAVNGDITLKPDNPGSDLKLFLKNFDMPGLTGFVEGDFGQSIKTGQFDLDSDIKIADKKIDAKNKLIIRKLALEKAKQPGKAEQSLGMPVDMALDMLRDDRGDITMDVPITGRLDDPNINVSDVINKALLSSMSAGAMTYAKLLLQPYGAILMAAEYAVGAAQDASKPKLTPIHFISRSTELDAEMTDYASKIAVLMKSKEFRLEICGVATRLEGAVLEQGDGQKRFKTAEDLQPMTDEALMKLAESRSDVVMKAIQDQGITAERLFNCRPNIDEKKTKAVPRVDLILD